jgi:asparagine synthase (glutamine-hydrolysing)
MACGLEARVPLLDHRIVEYVWTLPTELRVGPEPGKDLLRRVLARRVPRALFERPKMGFGIPLDAWLRGPLREWAEELFDARRIASEGILDPRPLRAAWEAHRSGRRNLGYYLWDVLAFQAWRERWLDAPPPAPRPPAPASLARASGAGSPAESAPPGARGVGASG